MPSVQFICSANRFRSPLAAGIFKQALIEEEKKRTFSWNIGKARDWVVGSAAIAGAPGHRALPLALEAGALSGRDLSGHRSQRVNEYRLSEYDLILVMEQAHRRALRRQFPHLRERIFPLSYVTEYASYDIPDTHDTLEEVLAVHDQMNELIRCSLRYICVLAIALHNQRIWDRMAGTHDQAAQPVHPTPPAPRPKGKRRKMPQLFPRSDWGFEPLL